jgi:hypothetical protein
MLLEARKPAWYGVIASCESTLDARQIARSLHRQGTHTPKTLPKLGAGIGAAASHYGTDVHVTNGRPPGMPVREKSSTQEHTP